MPQLPAELHNEIVKYLWDDSLALKACALATPAMTVPSQKRLFSCVAIRAPQELFQPRRMGKYVTGGSSLNFLKLLSRAPRIANYVESLFIIDVSWLYKPRKLEILAKSDSEPAADVEVQVPSDVEGNNALSGDDDDGGGTSIIYLPDDIPAGYRWLPGDKSLPMFLPSLHKLKALVVEYDLNWVRFSPEIFTSLYCTLQLPSLVYFRVERAPKVLLVLDKMLGRNVKHLAVDSDDLGIEETQLLLPDSNLPPVYLESLLIRDPNGFLCYLREEPGWRIQISKLRKLVLELESDVERQHAATSSLLSMCRDTLEEFVLTPCLEIGEQDLIERENYEEPIDLSRLPFLRKFGVSFEALYDNVEPVSFVDSLWWLTRLLRAYTTSHIKRPIEELAIDVTYGYSPLEPDIQPWKGVCDALLGDQFKSLKRLDIFLHSSPTLEEAEKVLSMLNNSAYMAELRLRRGLTVNIEVLTILSPLSVFRQTYAFAPDPRWEWPRWDDS